MENLVSYLPFLIPVLLIEIALAITALVHVLKAQNYRFGNRVLWIVVVLVFQIIGPILYFTVGRSDQ